MLAEATGAPDAADAAPLDRGHRHATAARQGPRRARAARADARGDDAGLEAMAEALRTTDSVTKVATTTVELPDADGRARDGDGERDREGRRDDPPEHGHDALGRADRCGRDPAGAVGPAATGRGPDLGPALGRWRHVHQRHGVRAGIGGQCGGAGRGRDVPRRPCSAPRSRPWPATSRDSRPPTARGPRRSSRPR